MKPISHVLHSLSHDVSVGTPTGKRDTPDFERVSGFDLEAMFRANPVVFNGVQKFVQTVMASPHRLVAQNGNEKARRFFLDFTRNVGEVGAQLAWESLLARIIQDKAIYGWAWVENVRNRDRVVDFDIRDAKRMDYLKDISSTADKDPVKNVGEIILDDKNRPVGYVEVKGEGRSFGRKTHSQNLPEHIQRYVSTNQVFFERDQLAVFKLYTVGDSFYPVGLIEPAYLTSVQKLNIAESITQSFLRHGAPILQAKLGDTSHEPTPTQIQNILEKLKDLNSKTEIAVPYYYDLEFLESTVPTEIHGQLEYYEDQEIAALGIPKAYATGKGQQTNRATLNNQDNLFKLSLRDLIRRTCETIRRQMFFPVAKTHGIKFEDVPCIEWDVVGVEELGRKIDRILKYVQAGLLTSDEGRALVKKIDAIQLQDL